jgi:hypothetical protein
MKVPRYPEEMRKELDPEHELTYGYFHCEKCGSSWYPGGGAMHKSLCTVYEFDPEFVVFRFGPQETMAVEWVEE